MAHMIETMVRNAETQVSWHGKESIIPADAAFDDWFDASGLNYKVLRSKVRYAVTRDADETLAYETMDSRHVLFRSDTLKPLAVVGDEYKVVQPKQVLEFFRDLCDTNRLVMDTAGVLAGGRRVWALARTGQQITVGGFDAVKAYVLLATSYDTSMSTVAKPTSVRVVCNNTLTMAYNNAEASIRVPHSATFNPDQVKLDLGLVEDAFTAFGVSANLMHEREIVPSAAARWYAELLLDLKDPITDLQFAEVSDNRVLRQLMTSFDRAPGAEQTMWGLLNGVTYTVDHVRGRGYDTRMNSAWFGAGDLLKRKAYDKAANDQRILEVA